MHICVTPVRFTGAGRTLVGGVLSDLMVEDTHRDFWAPVRLLRKMIADVKRAGEIDFLLTTTTTEAETVFKAGGFKPFGTLRRYVLPLNAFYLAAARLRAGVKRTKAQPMVFERPEDTEPALADPTWRPLGSAQFYQSRIPRLEYTDGKWVAVTNGKAAAGYALLARVAEQDELSLADAFWQSQGVRLGEVVHAAARWGRTQGFRKLTLGTVHESRIAAELQRCGFFPRDVRSLLLIHQTGQNPPPAAEDWFLSGFALSGW
jgi:hypothetical protein